MARLRMDTTTSTHNIGRHNIGQIDEALLTAKLTVETIQNDMKALQHYRARLLAGETFEICGKEYDDILAALDTCNGVVD